MKIASFFYKSYCFNLFSFQILLKRVTYLHNILKNLHFDKESTSLPSTKKCPTLQVKISYFSVHILKLLINITFNKYWFSFTLKVVNQYDLKSRKDIIKSGRFVQDISRRWRPLSWIWLAWNWKVHTMCQHFGIYAFFWPLRKMGTLLKCSKPIFNEKMWQPTTFSCRRSFLLQANEFNISIFLLHTYIVSVDFRIRPLEILKIL